MSPVALNVIDGLQLALTQRIIPVSKRRALSAAVLLPPETILMIPAYC
jgi:hypothetical protein